MRLAVVAAMVACRRDPIASCADDLGGVWESGSAGWHVLDSGREIEIDPLFADAPAGAAPRVIDLRRAGSGLVGTLHRLYASRADHCDATVPVRITACHDDTIEIVLADPTPPLTFVPCTWPRAASSRLERWQRR